jgi:crotonobetainyl-CoA:carnitine CoA-transferase CaiB-like acyl-CoA transferase
MNLLQHAGVRAAAVQTGAEMLQDAQLRTRRFYQPVEHPSAGTQTMRVAPYQLSETPPVIRRPSPRLGEHTESVLREVLGYSDDQLAELAECHLTDNVPLRFQSI